jgi:hypothetical protein
MRMGSTNKNSGIRPFDRIPLICVQSKWNFSIYISITLRYSEASGKLHFIVLNLLLEGGFQRTVEKTLNQPTLTFEEHYAYRLSANQQLCMKCSYS